MLYSNDSFDCLKKVEFITKYVDSIKNANGIKYNTEITKSPNIPLNLPPIPNTLCLTIV